MLIYEQNFFDVRKGEEMKNVKRNVIVSAFLAIALCMSMIAGATFALFTSNSSVNIAITSGNVKVTATASDLHVYSPTSIYLNGNVKDDTNAADEKSGKFVNGGSATLSGDTVTLKDMTPGDKATFTITVANESSVATKYRTSVVKHSDTGLFAGLNIRIDGMRTLAATEWKPLSAGNETVKSFECEVELPSYAGDDYKNTACEIEFKVEALQGNAVTVTEVSNETELRTALYNASSDGTCTEIKLTSDVTLEMLYAAENFGTETIADNAEGDTLNRYKIGVQPTAEDPNHWNPLVTDQTQEERVKMGAYYHVGANDERVARLVVKEGQSVVLDLNGHTIAKKDGATHGDWGNICTDIIGNYGSLTVIDTAEEKGMVKGVGYNNCNGAVLHNYNGSLTVLGATVFGNAEGMTAGTGQYVIVNDGGVTVIDGANVYDTYEKVDASLVAITSGTVIITGNATLNHPNTKVVNVKGGTAIIESTNITSDKYAVYVKGGKAIVYESTVTINGNGVMELVKGELIRR